jgi:hypothetical protein
MLCYGNEADLPATDAGLMHDTSICVRVRPNAVYGTTLMMHAALLHRDSTAIPHP